MPVIKEFESREVDITCLESLIAEHRAKPAVKKKLSGSGYSVFQAKHFAQKLTDMHKPIEFNFRAKFGLGEAPPLETTSQTIESSQTPDPLQNTQPLQNKIAEPAPAYAENKTTEIEIPAKLTLSKLAKSLNLKTAVLEGLLIDQGYLERREKGVYLTPKGKENGFEVRKGKFSFYFLIPRDFSLEVVVG